MPKLDKYLLFANNKFMRLSYLLVASFLVISSGCNKSVDPQTHSKLSVVATTTLVADLVHSIAGEAIVLESLMGPDTDPHLYKASASDLDKLRKADLIFYNGLHLEGRMDELLKKMRTQKASIFAVTDNINHEKLLFPPHFEDHPDPHVWFDPALWALGIPIVVKALSDNDPANATTYAHNGERLAGAYKALHEQALKEVATLPAENRILVTSHDAFNYFGRAFGFTVVGVQGISTATEAGLADVTQTIAFIKKYQVKAIFVETSVPHVLIERIAADANTKVGGELFSDALGPRGSFEKRDNGKTYDTGTYSGMMQHNLSTVINALR